MKTRTKAQILELIDKKGPVRPREIVSALKLTPQAIHRHLRDLLSMGKIETNGKPPKTSYVLAGRPNFKSACKWSGSKKGEEAHEVCQTRDVFTARLSQLLPLTKQGVSEDLLSLLISTVGEVGNNSFDHNLGHWIDIPGCWFEVQKTSTRLWVWISDRGRGIFESLSRVVPDLGSDQEAMEIAFKERVSGRSPERRGNGLKFVSSNIKDFPDRGLACKSGDGQIMLGELAPQCVKALDQIPGVTMGTVTVMVWELI